MFHHSRKPGFCRTGVLLFLWCVLAQTANGASISLSQIGGPDLVQTGDTLLFDVVLDFTDEPTLGGGFDFRWDPTALSLENLIYNEVGDPLYGRQPDIYDDSLEGWLFADTAGISGVHILGTLEFSVLASMGASTTLDFVCDGLHSCLFLRFDDLVAVIPTELQSTEISRVPVPAAWWLFVSSLFVLRTIRRQR